MPENDAEVHSYHQECRKSPGVKVRCVNVTVDITNTNIGIQMKIDASLIVPGYRHIF